MKMVYTREVYLAGMQPRYHCSQHLSKLVTLLICRLINLTPDPRAQESYNSVRVAGSQIALQMLKSEKLLTIKLSWLNQEKSYIIACMSIGRFQEEVQRPF